MTDRAAIHRLWTSPYELHRLGCFESKAIIHGRWSGRLRISRVIDSSAGLPAVNIQCGYQSSWMHYKQGWELKELKKLKKTKMRKRTENTEARLLNAHVANLSFCSNKSWPFECINFLIGSIRRPIMITGGDLEWISRRFWSDFWRQSKEMVLRNWFSGKLLYAVPMLDSIPVQQRHLFDLLIIWCYPIDTIQLVHKLFGKVFKKLNSLFEIIMLFNIV